MSGRGYWRSKLGEVLSSHWQRDRERGPKLTGGIKDESQNLEADLIYNHTK